MRVRVQGEDPELDDHIERLGRDRARWYSHATHWRRVAGIMFVVAAVELVLLTLCAYALAIALARNGGAP